jgi:hypothetical protein
MPRRFPSSVQAAFPAQAVAALAPEVVCKPYIQDIDCQQNGKGEDVDTPGINDPGKRKGTSERQVSANGCREDVFLREDDDRHRMHMSKCAS